MRDLTHWGCLHIDLSIVSILVSFKHVLLGSLLEIRWRVKGYRSNLSNSTSECQEKACSLKLVTLCTYKMNLTESVTPTNQANIKM